jgi:hypothetical protein
MPRSLLAHPSGAIPALLLALSACIAPCSAHAQASTTIIDDTFADNDRSGQSLPSSATWFVPSTASTGTQVRNNSLTLAANERDRSLTAYFPATTLNVGDALTFVVNFSLTKSPPSIPDGFRTLLAYTNGALPRRADGTVTGQYQGYGNFTNPGSGANTTRTRKRSGPAASRPTASLFEVTDGATDLTWDTFGSARTGLASAFQAGVTYTCTLRVQRTGTDSTTVTTTLSGGSLGAGNTLVENDASGAFVTFDTVALAIADTSTAGDLIVTRAWLVLEQSNVPSAPASSHLANLSVLTSLSSANDNFTLGFVVSGADAAHPKPLVIRAAGPSLGAFGVGGTVEDPRLELYASSTKITENDNWGGSASLTTAMAAVGAFSYSSTTSKDAALSSAITTRDNSVKVAATGPGVLIAEIYDATPADSYTSATPRLANVSVRKQIGTGLTAGFVISGSGNRSVLIRAIGPGLAAFGVSGTVADPQLRLIRQGTTIASNDNWGGTTELSAAFSAVGAFTLQPSSKDAALLIPLAPGDYTVEVSGVAGTAGEALVEIYEVP